MTNKWWKSLYDDLLAKVLLDATCEKDVDDTVVFLQNVLEVKPGDKLLDQCCGTGRLSLAMAKQGYDVLGVDLIDSYIEKAKDKAQTELSSNKHCRFVSSDAYEFVAEQPVHGIFNWWTSFGYSATDVDNIKMVQRAFDSLLPGGRFALDFMNVPGLYRHFQPHVVNRIEEPEGQLVLIRETRLDHTEALMHKTWSYFLPNGQQVQHQSQVRLYSPHELHRFFKQCGFTDVQVYGDIDKSGLTLQSPRCIVVGQKP